MEVSPVVEVGLPVALAVIMVSLGLELTPADFRRVFVFPRGVAIGLANLTLVSPLLGFLIAELFGLDPILAVGLVLLAGSPGGTMANLLTHLARGDTALSVTMTAISSLGALITVPLYLGLAAERFAGGEIGDVTMGGVVLRVFAITIVPLSVGMYLRARYPAGVEASRARVKRAAMVAFVAVVIAAVASEIDVVVENFGSVALATLTLNLSAMAISFAVARAARLSNRQATAIAMELGIHNSTLAIAVAGTIDINYAIPAAIYSAFMFITAGLFARLMRGRNADAAPVPGIPALAAENG